MKAKSKLYRLQRKRFVARPTIKNKARTVEVERPKLQDTSKSIILLRIIELVAAIAAILAVFFWAFYELPLIKNQRAMNAWSILDSDNASAEAKGKAIEYLLRTDQSLRGVDLSSDKTNHLSLEGIAAKDISIRRLIFNNSRWLMNDTKSFKCWYCDLTNSRLYLKSGTLYLSDSAVVGGVLTVDSGDLGVSYSNLTDAIIFDSIYGIEGDSESTIVSITGSLISGLKTDGVIVEILNSYSLRSNPPSICSTGEPIRFIAIDKNGSKYDFKTEGQDPFRNFIVSMENANRRQPWASGLVLTEVTPPIEYLEFIENNCSQE